MYPLFSDIGKAKVSKVIEAIEFVSADYLQDVARLPESTPKTASGTKLLLLWRNKSLETVVTRVLRNSQRKN